ncbi:MAG: sodium:alanine symporter family protein [Ruminococcus sp.]|nr:sodium:alanine symporter family protein [Ruminococcus sp.]
MLDRFLEAVGRVNGAINSVVWGWPMIILILMTGLLLSVRTRFLQVRRFKESLGTTILPTVKGLGKKQKKKTAEGSVSQFEAFSAAISGTVGTGNIVGVISAILTGGPGAVLWMWISAFFGMVTNYSENVLGLYFRKKNHNGELSGGPFYYIAYGLKWRWLAYVAAVFCLLASVGMSGVQTNKITGTVTEALDKAVGLEDPGVIKLIVGAVVAAAAGVIIIGGIKRIGRVASMLVPFMSLVFITLSLIAIGMHIQNVPGAFGMIFSKAFTFEAAGGGVLGYTFATVIRKGMARGVFSNEAGLGSSVIAHSASETKEPVKQGLWGVFEVFLDTFVICTMTSLTFLTTFDISSLTGKEDDAAMAIEMFETNFGSFGVIVYSIIMPLFAFTSILAWSYYGEKAVEFLFRKVGVKGREATVKVFKAGYIVLILLSTFITGDLIWEIDDTFNGLMALPNLICLIALSGLVARITKNYFDRRRGIKAPPMLSAYPDLNEEFAAEIENAPVN